MGRSIKKGPFVELHLLEKIQKAKDSKSKTPIKTWSRRSMITPDFVGRTVMEVKNPIQPTKNCMTCENIVIGDRLNHCSLDNIVVDESCFCTSWRQFQFGVEKWINGQSGHKV